MYFDTNSDSFFSEMDIFGILFTPSQKTKEKKKPRETGEFEGVKKDKKDTNPAALEQSGVGTVHCILYFKLLVAVSFRREDQLPRTNFFSHHHLGRLHNLNSVVLREAARDDDI